MSAGVMGVKLYTLVFPRDVRGARILLGFKKRGFGRGRWNGFGGKVEAGESVAAGAIRELREEAGLTAPRMAYCGRLLFSFAGGVEPDMDVRVFTTEAVGQPLESDEMRPQWFAESEVPFTSMWPDDRHWFPYLLAGQCFRGFFLFQGHDTILRQELNRVEPDQLDPLT